MNLENSPANFRKIRFGYVVAAKLTSRLLLMGLHEEKEVANAYRDRLQAYHDAKPDLGNIGQITMDDALTRRQALVAWQNKHPLGTSLAHFESYMVIEVPWLDPAILTNP